MSDRDPRTQFSDTMGKMLANTGSTLNTRLIDDVMTQNIVNTKSVRKLTGVTIPYVLSAFQTNSLQSAFPELKINFRNEVHHPHALAASSRKCEETLLL